MPRLTGRAKDERDLEIMRRLDAGETYAEISAAMGVSAPTIAGASKALKESEKYECILQRDRP